MNASNSSQIFKRLEWFKAGEPIPSTAKYIKSEKRKENVKVHEDNFGSFRDTYETYDEVEYHLYEVYE